MADRTRVAIKRVCRFRVYDNVAQLMRRLMHPAIQIGKSEAMHRFELNASADYRERARRSDRRFLLRRTAAIIVARAQLRAADSFAPAQPLSDGRACASAVRALASFRIGEPADHYARIITRR